MNHDDSPERPTVDVATPPGGWGYPWPNVEEIATVFAGDRWSLIGGLMTQLHAIRRGIGAVRPTNDVDIVLHVETARGTPNAAADALASLGYILQDSVDPRRNVAHRFTRGEAHVDVVDAVVADHAAPRIVERMRRREMVPVPGGTQALRRTANYRLELTPGRVTTISVPRPFGALILKAAAYVADGRDRDRHLTDAAVLLACVEDPLAELEQLAGSDRTRLAVLRRELGDGHPAWRLIPVADASRGRAVLRALHPDG